MTETFRIIKQIIKLVDVVHGSSLPGVVFIGLFSHNDFDLSISQLDIDRIDAVGNMKVA